MKNFSSSDPAAVPTASLPAGSVHAANSAPSPAASPAAPGRPAGTSDPPNTLRKRPAFFRPETWRAFGYHWLTLLLAPAGLAYFVVTVALGASLLVTVVGLVVPAALIVAARNWGDLHRGLTASLLDVRIPAPPPFAPRRGFFGFLRSGLADASGWRALAHMFLSFITSLTASVLSITFLAAGLGSLTHWYWYQWLPAEVEADGNLHRGGMIGPSIYDDSTAWQLAYVAVGLIFTFLIWPALNNGTARLQAALAAGLLGPTPAQQRVQDLESSRSSSVQDADARLQRIERDLHDGTQAQLVAIAMKLGDAKDRLAARNAGSPGNDGPGDSQADLQRLVGSAHGTAKEALVDLRGLARGIRPAVLNDGLDTALESLAGTAPVPVSLTYDLTARPAPAVEAIAYFSAAELINNAVKHSGASGIGVLVTSAPGAAGLRLQVRDNGSGGADPARGTGLAGLAERVQTVDGSLRVDSPAGGPTVVTVELPLS